MASYRADFSDGGSPGTGNRSVTVTPVIGDLCVVFVVVSANVNSTPAMSDSNSDGSTYTLINTALKASSVDIMSVFVRDKLFSNTDSTTITAETGSNTSGELTAVHITGMSKSGAGAVRQTARQEDQGAGGTPAPVFAASALTGNMTLGAVGNDSNPAGLAAPVGWTEQADVGQGNPPVGLETVTRDSGFTGTTITWGGTSASAFASIIVELDTAPVLEEEDTFWGTFNRNVVVGIAATVLTSSILTASIGQSLANSDQSDLEEFSPPSTIVEDDYWQNSVLPKDRTLYRNLPYLPDADDVPAGSLKNAPGTTDDYWQVVQAQLPYKRYLFNEKEDGIVPQPSPGNPPEDYWGTPGTVTPPDLYPEVLFLPFPLGSYGSDATTGAPPNFVEDYVQVVQDIHGYHLLPYVVGGSEETRFPLFGTLNEDFDWSRFFGPPRPVEASLYQRLPYLPDPEELVIEAPAAGGLDDEYWVNPVSPVVAGNFLVLPYLPDFEESSSGFLHGALVEDYWVNPVKPTAATMFVLHPHVPDKEEPDWIFLVTDEDYWISPVPLLIQPNKNGPIYFYDQGEIALFVALAEEDYWLVLVAPQAPTIYQRLPYLPEPEQVWVIAGRIKVGAISALPLVTMDVSATPVVEMDVKKHP